MGFEEEGHGLHSRLAELKVLLIMRDVSQTFGCSELETEFGVHQGAGGK